MMRLEDMRKLHEALDLIREIRDPLFGTAVLKKKGLLSQEACNKLNKAYDLVDKIAERINEELCDQLWDR